MKMLFETQSPLQSIFLFREIKKAGEIFFFEKTYPAQKRGFFYSRIESFNKIIIRLINPKVKIRSTSAMDASDYNWLMNKKAVDFVDSLANVIIRSKSYLALQTLLHDESLIKYFQHNVTANVAARLHFLCLSRDLASHHCDGEEFLIIPADRIRKEALEDLFGKNGIKLPVPAGIQRINDVRLFAVRILFAALFILSPVIFLCRRLGLIRLGRIQKKTARLSMPVILGVKDTKGIDSQFGKKMSVDDTYLYDRDIRRGDIIHLFGKWKRTEQLEKLSTSYFKEQGIPFADTREYRINGAGILVILKAQGYVCFAALKSLFFLRDPYYVLFFSQYAVHAYLSKEIELMNIDYEVELIKNDYSASHIIDTIVNNHHGKKTVGTQHVGVVYQSPELSYVHVNKYIVYGELFVRTYPHWKKIQLEKTGRENIDWVVQAARDPDHMAALRERFYRKYKRRKYNALILFPSGRPLNKKSQWDEIYEGLQLVGKTGLDVNVFLRFRFLRDLDEYPHLSRFKDLCSRDERFLLEFEDFTTQELISLSDLFIANSASFGINEAIPTGTRVFTFDFIGNSKFYFPDYGKDLILYSSGDLLRTFKGLESDFSGFDCKWERLRKESNYNDDGRNLERIRSAIRRTFEEADRTTSTTS